MILTLMYHQIVNPNVDPNIIINKFTEHLKYLQKNFEIILPGQTILKNKKYLCLTFDDAYVDFYYYIFPILETLSIPAVLAIPTGLIQDTTTVNMADRLAVTYPDGLHASSATKVPLCTWQEIRTMVATGLVYPASHSLNHANLTKIDFSAAYQEICLSKRAICLKLEKITEVFIYPFGAYNKAVHSMVKNHYKYVFRIGSALNNNWKQNILYRINADPVWQKNKVISTFNILLGQAKYGINMVLGK